MPDASICSISHFARDFATQSKNLCSPTSPLEVSKVAAEVASHRPRTANWHSDQSYIQRAGDLISFRESRTLFCRNRLKSTLLTRESPWQKRQFLSSVKEPLGAKQHVPSESLTLNCIFSWTKIKERRKRDPAGRESGNPKFIFTERFKLAQSWWGIFASGQPVSLLDLSLNYEP